MIVTQEIRNEIIQLYDNVLKKHYGIDDKVINALPKIKYTHMKKPSKAETDNIVL